MLKVKTVVALPILSDDDEVTVNDAPLKAILGNAALMGAVALPLPLSWPVLYCNVTTAVVTVSPAGMFTVTGMPPLRGLGEFTTKLMELLPSGPRAKSG